MRRLARVGSPLGGHRIMVSRAFDPGFRRCVLATDSSSPLWSSHYPVTTIRGERAGTWHHTPPLNP
jgi:hypothetical protein